MCASEEMITGTSYLRHNLKISRLLGRAAALFLCGMREDELISSTVELSREASTIGSK